MALGTLRIMSDDVESEPRRRMKGVLWRSGRVTITYDDGSTNQAIVSPTTAQGMAEEAGLVAVTSPDGTMRWALPPA